MANEISRSVWKLQAEGKDVINELQKVKKGFIDSNAEAKKFASQNKDLAKGLTQQYKEQEGAVNKLRFAIQATENARNKSNDPALIQKYNRLLDEQRVKMTALTSVHKEEVKVIGIANNLLVKQADLIKKRDAATSLTQVKAFNRELVETEKQLRKIQGQKGGLFGGAGGAGGLIAGAAGGFGILSVVNGLKTLGETGIEQAINFETTRISFETMLGSGAAAQKFLSELVDFAAKTPFQLPELEAASRQLLAFGIPAKDITNTLKQLGDVAAGTNQPIGELAFLFGKAKSLTIADNEILNQFATRGIPVYDVLAKKYGTNTLGVKKLAEQNKITFGDLQEAFDSLTVKGGKFFGLTEKLSQSTSGKISTLKDNFNLLLQGIGDKALPGINKLVDALAKVVQGDFKASDLFTIFDKITFFVQAIPSPLAGMIKGFKDFRGALDSFQNGKILDGISKGLGGVLNIVTLGISGSVRNFFVPSVKKMEGALTGFEKTQLDVSNATDQQINAKLKELQLQSPLTAIAFKKMADDIKKNQLEETFRLLAEQLEITEAQFKSLIAISDKYGISQRTNADLILAGRDLVRQLNRENISQEERVAIQKELDNGYRQFNETLGVTKVDYDQYLGILNKVEDKTQDVTDLNKKKSKSHKDLSGDLQKLREQLQKLQNVEKEASLADIKGLDGLKKRLDLKRQELAVDLLNQKVDIEKQFSGDPVKLRQALAIFNDIVKQSFANFDADRLKQIDAFNKEVLAKAEELNFTMRQNDLINIKGEEEDLLTALNERYDRELKLLKDQGELTIEAQREIEQRRGQEIIAIHSQFAENDFNSELQALDLLEQTKLAKIKGSTIKQEKERSKIQLEFAQARLVIAQQLLSDLVDQEEELGSNVGLRNQIEEAQNLVQKLNNEIEKIGSGKNQQSIQKIANILKQITTITDAIVDGIRKVIAEQQRQTDFEIEQQQKRVDSATSLAEKGNAEILEQEKKRMDKLLDERKKAVAAQKALDAIQFVSSSIVAIANAAAQGGGFASIATVAAVIGAIAGGIALVSSLASGFEKGGYTGDGDKHQPAGIVHKGEFVNTKEKTATSKKALMAIHDGNFDDKEFESYKQWKQKRNFQLDYSKFSLSRFSQRIVFPESTVRMMGANVDVSGIHERLDRVTEAVKNVNTQVPVMNDKGVFHLAESGKNKTNRILNKP